MNEWINVVRLIIKWNNKWNNPILFFFFHLQCLIKPKITAATVTYNNRRMSVIVVIRKPRNGKINLTITFKNQDSWTAKLIDLSFFISYYIFVVRRRQNVEQNMYKGQIY